jgi:hypothetical protein
MHWTTYRHIPGDAPEKPARPKARQANSVPDAASRTLHDQIERSRSCSRSAAISGKRVEVTYGQSHR